MGECTQTEEKCLLGWKILQDVNAISEDLYYTQVLLKFNTFALCKRKKMFLTPYILILPFRVLNTNLKPNESTSFLP